MGRRSTYSTEFKQEAVKLVLEQGLSLAQVAEDLGVGKSTLDKWLRSAREQIRDPNALKDDERAELQRLRKEVHLLRIERDLLKKTAIYFAKDTSKGTAS